MLRLLRVLRVVPRGICTSAARSTAVTSDKPSRPESKSPEQKPRGNSCDSPSSPFVSQHYALTPGTVHAYVARHELSFKESGEHLIVRDCPFCHDTGGKASNLYKLYILRQSGVYHCFRCGASGTWWSFRRAIDGVAETDFAKVGGTPSGSLPGVTSSSPVSSLKSLSQGHPTPTICHDEVRRFQENLRGNLNAVEYLHKVRGLNLETAQNFGVGCTRHSFLEDEGSLRSHLCLVFPMTSHENQPIRLKIRSIERKSAMKLVPKGSMEWGLFGLGNIAKDARDVVITEGEFDAMAVHQATGLPAISVPNGASSFPVNCIPLLERFNRIFVWFDDDIAGHSGAQKISRKLGVGRCFIVTAGESGSPGGPKDANEALCKGVDLLARIRQARRLEHDQIVTFKDLRAGIWTELISPGQSAGAQSTWLPGLNRVWKGFRKGELTIFTGHTGSGKTTLLSQLSLDYCIQGIPTIWGSFEINNVRLAKQLLTQFFCLKTNLTSAELTPRFEPWAAEFEGLPMYFMKFFGSVPIDTVIDTMEYASYVHDVTHVVLDNLQFMTSGQGRGYEKFDVMDDAISKCRKFASEHDCHVSLVVHPRKENDADALQLASIFGSAKATQESDNVIILQRGEKNPFLEVKKNRYDGQLGRIPVLFDYSRKVFVDASLKTALPAMTTDAEDVELLRRVRNEGAGVGKTSMLIPASSSNPELVKAKGIESQITDIRDTLASVEKSDESRKKKKEQNRKDASRTRLLSSPNRGLPTR
mmetsp:Transcript_12010/g.24458  ORF Transcript_12010/g.24458 Transcript_12010/m.24458 type:complete len:758 (-) Transcript_12010:3951-6224(-)